MFCQSLMPFDQLGYLLEWPKAFYISQSLPQTRILSHQCLCMQPRHPANTLLVCLMEKREHVVLTSNSVADFQVQKCESKVLQWLLGLLFGICPCLTMKNKDYLGDDTENGNGGRLRHIHIKKNKKKLYCNTIVLYFVLR